MTRTEWKCMSPEARSLFLFSQAASRSTYRHIALCSFNTEQQKTLVTDRNALQDIAIHTLYTPHRRADLTSTLMRIMGTYCVYELPFATTEQYAEALALTLQPEE